MYQDKYNFSTKDVVVLLLMSLGFNLYFPMWMAMIVVTILAAIFGWNLEVFARLEISFLIGYILCFINFYRDAKAHKAYYHPQKIAEREAKHRAYIEELERKDAERAAQSYPIRMGKARELVEQYAAIPTASPEIIERATREINACEDYRQINAWDYTPLREQMSDAIWEYNNPKPTSGFTQSTDFYSSPAWRRVRADALHHWGDAPCACCNTPFNGRVKHVDHIKPRSKYPKLALVLSNLQVMCEDCNMGKGNRHEYDWRSDEQKRRMGAI